MFAVFSICQCSVCRALLGFAFATDLLLLESDVLFDSQTKRTLILEGISASLRGHKEDSSARQAMSEFWKEHSKAQSLEEMMLDTKAQVLTLDEQPEILSLLDTYVGGLERKNILELGAGIGLVYIAQSRH